MTGRAQQFDCRAGCHHAAVRDRRVRKRSGFSLLELVVVLAIIGLLIAMALPAIERARAAARKTRCLSNLRNLTFGITQFEQAQGRLPASGNVGLDATGNMREYHNWVVTILPWIDQQNLAAQWNSELPLSESPNSELATTHLAVLTCPEDNSVQGSGDLSYVVNGGVGFTIRNASGVDECPVDVQHTELDLNANGITCPADSELDGHPSDGDRFKAMGLFFLEPWGSEGGQRHYRLDDIIDGTSQTILLTENVRTGTDPLRPEVSFASSNPRRCAFYIPSPCIGGDCTRVDYSGSNSGPLGINKGLTQAEGEVPAPNSFHPGGVHMAFADGHARFVSESLDGGVYAALMSPQGRLLDDSSLRQVLVSEW